MRKLIWMLLFLNFITFADSPIVCNTRYALCSAAACQKIPSIKGKVLCKCSIWKGYNIGYSSCSQRKKLLSTFSFGGSHYRYMKCRAKNLWASCLDQPCKVDKRSIDGRRAFCTCKLMPKSAFVTFAGECQKKYCSAAIWSGASIEGNAELTQALAKVVGQKALKAAVCKSQ